MNADFRAGETIEHRWEVENVFRGGMGLVYVVTDRRTGERLAAKTYRDDRFAADPALAARFEREAFAWIRLGAHPNVVEAKYVKTIRNRPFLFLEYVPGGSLLQRLPLTDLGLVRQLAIEFCTGMIHAANSGIVAHRDIKPENCLLGNADLKVADFGMVKVFDDLDVPFDQPFVIRVPDCERPESEPDEPGTVDDTLPSRLRSLSLLVTRTGVAAGTPCYMAPEQFDDFKRVGVQADIYSFGVMLFQMITGRLPFAGRNLLEYRALHQRMAPPKVGMGEPACLSWVAAHEREREFYRHAGIDLAKDGLPQALAGIVDRCLAKDPGQRYGDFGEVREALRHAEPRHPDLTYGQEALVESPVPRRARPLTGFELFASASKCLELGLRGRALAALDRLIERYPWSRWAHVEKGKLLMTVLDRCEEGRAILQRGNRSRVEQPCFLEFFSTASVKYHASLVSDATSGA
jgi:serine/threonine protein kinase